MLHFFRRLRKEFLVQERTRKYLLYAVGEVLLIMIGIFMALQLQNWNENRKREIQFKNTAEQLYNEITDDSWHFSYAIRELEKNVFRIDHLLEYHDQERLDTIPNVLWAICFDFKTYPSKSISIIDDLHYNLDDPSQVQLANQFSDYQDLLKIKYSRWINLPTELEKYLLEHNIPFPKFDFKQIQKGFITDSTYYTPKDLQNTSALLQDENFRTRLRTHRTYLSTSYLDFKSMEEESNAMLQRIKTYYPQVKLLYEDVGIIGTSINGYDDVGANSTPMNLKNDAESIWEIELFLKQGTVKFRCRDSWAINWGGENFPKGTPETNGPDIPVNEPGIYRIVLNLTANTYEFIKQDD